MNSAMIRTFPLLSQEGWREAPGWFQSDILRECGFGTTPRVIASQSRCPPNLGGHCEFLTPIQFTHTFIDRPYSQAIRSSTGCPASGLMRGPGTMMPTRFNGSAAAMRSE